mgnify:CR=1 FL=1
MPKLRRLTKENFYAAAALAAAIVLLYWWHPGCVYKKYFGFECISCGLSRGCFALMRFRFAQAWRFNPLSFCMPLWGVWIILRGQPFTAQRANRAAFWALVSVTGCFVILRVILMIINT